MSACLSFCISTPLWLYVCISVCLYLLCVAISLCVPLCFPVCVCVCLYISVYLCMPDCTRIASSHCRKTSSMSMHLHVQPRTCTRIHPHTDRCTPKAKERFMSASARGHTRTYMLAACRLHALVLSSVLADRLVLSPLLATLCFQHQLCTCIFAWCWSFA